MSEILTAKVRQERGSNAIRRLRREGYVPAVLYGHGQENISLSLRSEQVHPAVHQGTKLVDLQGDLRESALVRDVQWDTFGNDILHVDLFRVSVGESVEMKVALVLKGEAPGARNGGIVELVLHELDIVCPVTSLPDRIEVNVNSLELAQSIPAGDIPLPAGSRLVTDPEQVVVQCTEATPEAEEDQEGVATDEPEVIARKGEDGEEENKD